MKLSELIAQARLELDDKKSPGNAGDTLWSDPELASYAVDAENEACRRARLLVDSSTTSVVEIGLAAGEASYDMDPRILFIRRVRLATRSQPLQKKSYKDLDQQAPGWEEVTGDPYHYITDFETDKIRFYPTPTADDVVTLTVVRLPLREMKADSDCPEIKPHLHRSLIYWIKYRAYSKQDAETKNERKAADNLALFEQEFGPASSAVNENWISQNHGSDTEDGTY